MEKLLAQVTKPNDVQNIKKEELPILAQEIRELLLNSVSKTGGHLASNLGIVELTIALHYCLNLEKDKIVWDVGHQCYVHKILTGRGNNFSTLRQFKGLSGFPKLNESYTDIFETGHSSTSISVALGIAVARDLKKSNEIVIALIGDGSLTGGVALEALNNAGQSKSNLIVILNDNEMSISNNVGGLTKYLSSLRVTKTYLNAKKDVHNILNKIPFLGKNLSSLIEKIKERLKYFIMPGIFFEELGFKYLGPVYGHDINHLIEVINNTKTIKGPILLHVKTVKGKGYKFAEEMPSEYHGVSSFDIETGKVKSVKSEKTYSQIFGETIADIGLKNDKVVGVTAAMSSGTGFTRFQNLFPNRFFDIGIAEQHGVSFAAGLATNGMIPIFAVYSTFLQRAYDQILEDVCLMNLHVIFAIDRAGIVGNDGETHQGVFDISFLTHMPNITIFAPRNGNELTAMLHKAVSMNSPVAIRYPRGNAELLENEPTSTNIDININIDIDIDVCKPEFINLGHEIAIISCGNMFSKCEEVYNKLKSEGKNPTLVNTRIIKPLDLNMVKNVCSNAKYIFIVEDNVKIGGFGSLFINEALALGFNNKVFSSLGFPDKFIEQGSQQELFELYNLDSAGIYNNIISVLKER